MKIQRMNYLENEPKKPQYSMPNFNPPYYKIERWILKAFGLDVANLYGFLLAEMYIFVSHKEQYGFASFPTKETMMRKLGILKERFRRAFNTLTDEKLIGIFRPKGKGFTTLEYYKGDAESHPAYIEYHRTYKKAKKMLFNRFNIVEFQTILSIKNERKYNKNNKVV